jgi:hypothetical protein
MNRLWLIHVSAFHEKATSVWLQRFHVCGARGVCVRVMQSLFVFTNKRWLYGAEQQQIAYGLAITRAIVQAYHVSLALEKSAGMQRANSCALRQTPNKCASL